MSVTAIITAAIVVGCVGILIGFFLGIAGEKFKVEVDEREEAILGVLPGNNCGGCGYAGCSGLAAAIVKGEAPVNQCPVGGAPVAAKVGEIMGVKAEEGAKQGVENTKKYVAKFGRAKSLLERAIGHQDAGATSVYLIFQGMREFVEGKLA